MTALDHCRWAGLVLATFAAACVPKPPAAERSPDSMPAAAAAPAALTSLAGTAWHWVALQAPAEQVMIDDPARYTLTFGADGKVAVGADCNRGAGGYTEIAGGALSFTPLALTRAMCPPGSFDTRFVAALQSATRYRIEDSQLVIETTPETGNLVFRRAP